MLLEKWTPELIAQALRTLTDTEQRALQAQQSLKLTHQRPGTTTLKRHNFTNVAEWSRNYESAKAKMKAYFAALKIESITDLDFDEPHRTMEGRLSSRPTKQAKAQERQRVEPVPIEPRKEINIDTIVELRDQGLTWREIADRLDAKQMTVYKRWRQHEKNKVKQNAAHT